MLPKSFREKDLKLGSVLAVAESLIISHGGSSGGESKKEKLLQLTMLILERQYKGAFSGLI